METEEDENINKRRQIDNLTQQATCDEVRPFKCSYYDRHFTKTTWTDSQWRETLQV